MKHYRAKASVQWTISCLGLSKLKPQAACKMTYNMDAVMKGATGVHSIGERRAKQSNLHDMIGVTTRKCTIFATWLVNQVVISCLMRQQKQPSQELKPLRERRSTSESHHFYFAAYAICIMSRTTGVFLVEKQPSRWSSWQANPEWNVLSDVHIVHTCIFKS